MPKDLDFNLRKVSFVCSSCNAKFEIISSHAEDSVKVDICSCCHPFYLGKTNLTRKTGPAEKLKDKFNAGKDYLNKKKK